VLGMQCSTAQRTLAERGKPGAARLRRLSSGWCAHWL